MPQYVVTKIGLAKIIMSFLEDYHLNNQGFMTQYTVETWIENSYQIVSLFGKETHAKTKDS